MRETIVVVGRWVLMGRVQIMDLVSQMGRRTQHFSSWPAPKALGSGRASGGIGSAPALAKVRSLPSLVRVSILPRRRFCRWACVLVADGRVVLFICREIGRADYSKDWRWGTGLCLLAHFFLKKFGSAIAWAASICECAFVDVNLFWIGVVTCELWKL